MVMFGEKGSPALGLVPYLDLCLMKRYDLSKLWANHIRAYRSWRAQNLGLRGVQYVVLSNQSREDAYFVRFLKE